MKTRPSDIFVVTTPKAGTTWMQQIVYQLRSKGETLALSQRPCSASWCLRAAPSDMLVTVHCLVLQVAPTSRRSRPWCHG